MRLRRVRRWQWALLGLVLGLGLGHAYGGTPDLSGFRTYNDPTGRQFRRDLRRTVNGEPAVRNLVVYPQATALNRPAHPVRFDMPWGTPQGVQVLRHRYYAYIPFLPVDADNPAGREGNTIVEFLERVTGEGRYAQVTWRYAWWSEPRWAYLLGVGAGLVLLGGVLPTLIRRLVPADPDETEEASIWERLRRPAPTPQPVGPSDADRAAAAARQADALDAAIAGYAASAGPGQVLTDESASPGELSAGGVGGTATSTGGAGAPPAIRPLPDNPDTRTDSPTDGPSRERPDHPERYDGEYYPVARPGGQVRK